ncbi:MAG TPA: hypothetical protein VNJ29_01580 [Candidatus Nitrosotenuis sp.]|jgi:hypothetical protein|nr:hypothetical protein [Candidatus Nitrosotenuis sp.]
MRRIFILLLGFIITLPQSHGLDKDEYLSDLYNTLYQGDYSTLEEKVETAIEAWDRRTAEARDRASPFGKSRFNSISAKPITPQDEAAIKQGAKFCESNYSYWIARRKKVEQLKDASSYYHVHIKNILENSATEEIINTYPNSTLSLPSDVITKDCLDSLKSKTMEAWENHLKELKASFYRTIKAERSELFCQDNGYIVGSVFSGLSSLYRKSSRLYEWKEPLSDIGPKFEEYYKIFEEFQSYYKGDSTYLYIICTFYPLERRKDYLEKLLFTIEQIEEDLDKKKTK